MDASQEKMAQDMLKQAAQLLRKCAEEEKSSRKPKGPVVNLTKLREALRA